MKRLVPFLAALAGAFGLAALTVRPPAPLPANAPAGEFSALRAFVDVREIARAPHPTGSPENARVREHLVRRLQAIGLQVSLQPGVMSPEGRERLVEAARAPYAAAARPVNIVAVLPGLDHSQPVVAVMAHYDSVPGSPGATDDGAGVAAALEIARALRSQPPLQRDFAVVLTDAEEANLDGATNFFDAHPLADRLGAIINLETRGGAGRAMMFETGPRNGAMMALFSRVVERPTAQSVAVLMYRVMPNSTDYTRARDRIAGFNFAFLDGPASYHSPQSTPDALDLGSLQHLGGQALAVARGLTSGRSLPPPAADAVFGDVLGLKLAIYPVWAGWVPLVLSAALVAFAAVRARRAGAFRGVEVVAGAAAALSLLLHGALALQLGNLISNPETDYFDRLAAIPRLELQALAVMAAVLIGVFALRRPRRRWLAGAPALAAGLGVVALGGSGAAVAGLGLGLLASAVAVFGPSAPPNRAAGWTGALVLLLALAAAVQAAWPLAAPLFAWPLLAAGLSLALAAALDPRLEAPRALWAVVIVAVVAGAQGLGLAHLAFLGVGPAMPAVMALFGLLLAVLVWPLVPREAGRPAAVAVALLLVLAAGLAASVRFDPPAASVPVYRR